MGLFGSGKPKDEQKADNNRHAAIKKAQNGYKNKDRKEDVTFRQLNAARAEAEKDVPWWRR